MQISNLFRIPDPPELSKDLVAEFISLHNLPKTRNIPDPKCLLGIEVEVENVLKIDPNLLLGFWECKEDGSLRNHGREFVTKPTRASDIEAALTHLSQCLNASVDFSNRTSVHVHMDARHFTVEQLQCLLMIYTVVENLLFKFAGNNRRNSIFCVPLQDTMLLNNIDEKWLDNLRRINGNWTKYSALNLLPLETLGTIEFRHMPGTMDVDRLMNWIGILLKLKIASFQISLDEIKEIILRLNTTSEYYLFVTRIFGEYCRFIDMTNLKLDMEKAVRSVKHCAAVNKCHLQYIERFKRESSVYKSVIYQQEVKSKPKKVSIDTDRVQMVLDDFARIEAQVQVLASPR